MNFSYSIHWVYWSKCKLFENDLTLQFLAAIKCITETVQTLNLMMTTRPNLFDRSAVTWRQKLPADGAKWSIKQNLSGSTDLPVAFLKAKTMNDFLLLFLFLLTVSYPSMSPTGIPSVSKRVNHFIWTPRPSVLIRLPSVPTQQSTLKSHHYHTFHSCRPTLELFRAAPCQSAAEMDEIQWSPLWTLISVRLCFQTF